MILSPNTNNTHSNKVCYIPITKYLNLDANILQIVLILQIFHC